MKVIQKYRLVIIYGVSLAVLLSLLRWLELRLLIVRHAFELYAGAIAIIFTAFGIWLAMKLTRPRIETRVIEKEVFRDHQQGFKLNEKAVERLALSRRELEVLELMARGQSNQEIAASLFVSLNTIKTHTSRLFDKMEVKRRTQAIEMGKREGLIP